MKYIFDKNDALEDQSSARKWFLKLDRKQQENWIIQVFKTGQFFPVPLIASDDISDTFLKFFKRNLDDNLTWTVLNRVFKKLIDNLKTDDIYDMNFIDNILQTILRLEINSTYDGLIRLAQSKKYINVYANSGFELQELILQILYSSESINDKLTTLCKSMVSFASYSFLSYRKLYEINWENGIKFLPQLVNTLDVNEDREDFNSIFSDYVKLNQGVKELLCDNYSSLLEKVESNKKNMLLTTLEYVSLIEDVEIYLEQNPEGKDEDDSFHTIYKGKILDKEIPFPISEGNTGLYNLFQKIEANQSSKTEEEIYLNILDNLDYTIRKQAIT